MIEFKFACTNCGQHIQANDAYSGRQILCPTCKNQLLVPAAPGAVASKSGLSISAPPAPTRSQTAAPISPSPLVPKKNSNTKVLMVCGIVALVLIGATAGLFFSGLLPGFGKNSANESSPAMAAQKSPNNKKGKRDASGNTTPTASQTPSAEEIIQKVTEQYESLTSYSATGAAVLIFDMSGVDPKTLPGMSGIPQSVKDSKEFKEAMSKPQKQESEFHLKLGKPDFYRLDWEGQMGPAKNKGAVWSSGKGDFLLRAAAPIKYVKMESRDLALSTATAISGGVGGTIPAIFFKTESNPLNALKTVTRSADETIDGTDCYVLAGDLKGLKMILWIDKNASLIKQKQIVLGGKLAMPDVSEEKIQEGMKQLGGRPTTEQQAQMKAMAKNLGALASQMKGTMTETYQNIETNPPLTKKDFDYDVPPGARLSASLF